MRYVRVLLQGCNSESERRRRAARTSGTMVRCRVITASFVQLAFVLTVVAQFSSTQLSFPNCSGLTSNIQNAWCEEYNNNADCGYDGGDCCSCSCQDEGSYYKCGDFAFNCSDPSCPDEAANYVNCAADTTLISDGSCDAETNNPLCGYDGGDCCGCTCVDGSGRLGPVVCGTNGFVCLDPACPGEAFQYPNCTGDAYSMANGYCDAENNNAMCGYDGGDCCPCTCTQGPEHSCGDGGYACLDPDAGDELFECQKSIPVAAPCSADVQRDWDVESPTQATALAGTVNCSGGVFEVRWKGGVVVDQAILIVDGTVLNVTGIGSGAGMDGSGSSRLFTVINSSLHVTNMYLRSGHTAVGGAIAAAATSSMTFDGTSFIGNNATSSGGALYVVGTSNVSFSGETSFTGNSAAVDGGTIYVEEASTVYFNGVTRFTQNSAADDGGALFMCDGSRAYFRGESFFVNNTATGDGGMFLCDRSIVHWEGETSFFNNRADDDGGCYICKRRVYCIPHRENLPRKQQGYERRGLRGPL